MTRARNIAGFSTITTTPSPVNVGPIGVLTATRIDGEFGDRLDISARNLTVAGIAATHLQVSGITTGLNVSGIITAQNGINFNGTSTGLNVSGVGTIATLNVSGNATVGGVLTYEDVTRVDSIGIVTARGLSIFGNTTGLQVASGISTFQAISGTSLQLGTTVLNERAHIHTASSAKAQMQFTNTTTGTSASDGFTFGITGGEEVVFANQENTDMYFSTNNIERLRIDSTGKIGVNTDFSGSQTWRNGQTLEIFGGGGNVTGELHLGANRGDGVQAVGSINFFDNTQDTDHKHVAIIEADKAGSTANKRGGDLIFYTKTDNVAAPTERLRITSAGFIGVNNTSPSFVMDLKRAGADILRLNNSGETTHGNVDAKIVAGGSYYQNFDFQAYVYKFQTYNGSSLGERLRITAAGNIGVGTATPIASSNYANLSLAGSTGGQVEFKKLHDNISHFVWGTTDLNIGAGYLNGGSTNLKIFTNGNNERLRIGASGEVSLRRGGLSATPSLEIYGSGNASDTVADNLRFHNWGNSDGDYWDVGVNHGLDASGNNTKPSTTLKAAAIRFNAKNGAVTLITSPGSTSTQYEGLTQNQNGYVTIPNQPVFSYKQLANSNSNSRMTSDGDMLFTNSVVSSSHYDNSNGRFTSPITATYYFHVNALLDDNASAGTRVIRIKINGNIVQTIVYHWFAMQGGAKYYHASGGSAITVTAGDYVTFFGSEGWHVGSETNVSGFLIC